MLLCVVLVLISSLFLPFDCDAKARDSETSLKPFLSMVVGQSYEALQEEGGELMRAMQVRALAEEAESEGYS